MKLVTILSVIACSYAAKLDRTYLPPASAATAGGGPGSLIAPSRFGPSSTGFRQSGSPGFSQSSGGFKQPSAQPNASGPTGPQGQVGFNQPSGPSVFGQSGPSQPAEQGFDRTQGFEQAPSGLGQTQDGFSGANGSQNQRVQTDADRNAEILRYENQNDGETFSYSFETSNGISAEESGVATNGVQAQGAYSYTGDDGQSYSITYTADENGYQPQGDHLPTPHPIPEEIMRSIEQNARAAAAGTQEGAYNPDEDNQSLQAYNSGSTTYQGQGQAPGGFNQPQGGQGGSYQGQTTQLSGGTNGFAPSGSKPGSQAPGFNQGSSGQFNQQGNFTLSGQSGVSSRPQPGGRGSQLQGGDSGYQYDRPQANQPSQGSAGQYRPQYNQASQVGSQGAFNRPSSPGSFGPSSSAQGSRPQSPNKPQYDSQRPSVSSVRPSGANQGSFSPSGAGQGSVGPIGSSQGSFSPSASIQGSFGPSGSTQGSFRPSGSSQRSFSPSGPNQESSRPSAPSQNTFRPSSQSGSSMSVQGYQYNRPGTQVSGTPALNAPAEPRAQGGFNYQRSQSGSRPSVQNDSVGQDQAASLPGAQIGSQGGFQSSQAPQVSSFGGPRQPPSFSEEEGYKY